MKKITLQLFLVFPTVFSYAQTNLISNGTLDDATGWTLVNFTDCCYEEVTFAGGNATWPHSGGSRAIYQSVDLEAGTYQFDMDVTHGSDIVNAYGEVYVGSSVPVQNSDYQDTQVLRAFHTWGCGTDAYTGLASASGCDESTTPGEFTIATAGTYYLVIKIGESYGNIGASGVVVDNITLYDTASLSLEDFNQIGLSSVYNKNTRSLSFISEGVINSIAKIQIFDMSGKRVHNLTKINNLNAAKIDLNGTPNGLYLVQAEINGSDYVNKVLVY